MSGVISRKFTALILNTWLKSKHFDWVSFSKEIFSQPDNSSLYNLIVQKIFKK